MLDQSVWTKSSRGCKIFREKVQRVGSPLGHSGMKRRCCGLAISHTAGGFLSKIHIYILFSLVQRAICHFLFSFSVEVGRCCSTETRFVLFHTRQKTAKENSSTLMTAVFSQEKKTKSKIK